MENQKRKEKIIDWIFRYHNHHMSNKCSEARYPYVNSLELEKFINKLWKTKKKK